MTDARMPDMKEDWLAGNAAIAFVGVLLVAQSYKLSDGVYELPFNVTVLAFHDYVYLSVASFLFVSSVVLAVASTVPALRCQIVSVSRPFQPLLGFLVWVAYTVSWLEAISNLPADQWWRPVLVFVGFAFFLFLGFRLIRTVFQLLRMAMQSITA